MNPFVHGVASGDPTPTSVLLWTRVPSITTGSRPVRRIRWEVADASDSEPGPRNGDEPQLGRTVAAGEVATDGNGFARVTVDRLHPGRAYRYRFSLAAYASPIGRTATLPSAVVRFRLGLACCAHWPSGDFGVYDALARACPDLFVHLGDYIYQDGGDGPRGSHDPPHECTTEADYRRRYAQYRRDPDLLAAHAAAPWIAVWDDHEVADDGWRRGSRSETDGPWEARLRAARAAHADWMPQRPHGNGPTPLDRLVPIGDLADLVVVDTRYGGRSRPIDGIAGPALVPDNDEPTGRTILSAEQWDWLERCIAESTKPWILLVTSVQLAPLRLARLPVPSWPPRLAPLVNPGQWDGYPTERRRLRQMLSARAGEVDPPGIVALSGDLHGRFVVGRTTDRAICEITTPAVSGPPFAELVRRRVPIPPRALRTWLHLLNRHFDHLDLDHHGGTVIDIAPDELVVTAVAPNGSPAGSDGRVWRLPRRSARPSLPG